MKTAIQPQTWFCHYCTWRSPASTSAKLLYALVEKHVEEDCPHHPMRRLEARIRVLEGQQHAFRAQQAAQAWPYPFYVVMAKSDKRLRRHSNKWTALNEAGRLATKMGEPFNVLRLAHRIESSVIDAPQEGA